MIKKFIKDSLSRFQLRYGTAVPDNDYPTNEFIENILDRRTIRKFSDKEIDPKLIEKLIAAAQSAPTSSMLQPWSLISLSKEKRKILYSEKNQSILGISAKKRNPSDLHNLKSLTDCPLYLIWLADWSILKFIYTDSSLNDYFDKNISVKRHLANEASSHLHYELRTIIDAVIAAHTFVLAAESVGLGVQYMGSIRNMDLKEDLNLPDHVMPLFGICVGYPADSAGINPYTGNQINPKPRLPQTMIFHEDSHQPIDVKKLHEYNDLMKDFYKYNKMENDWFFRTIDRTYPLESSFRELAKKYGFLFK